jgi:hypothetical protein
VRISRVLNSILRAPERLMISFSAKYYLVKNYRNGKSGRRGEQRKRKRRRLLRRRQIDREK